MRGIITQTVFFIFCTVSAGYGAGDYRGDTRCPLPKDWSGYSQPYEPLDHPHEYPDFPEADRRGWSCSYQREDGVIVQYGDSRTPKEQWLSVWRTSAGQSD